MIHNHLHDLNHSHNHVDAGLVHHKNHKNDLRAVVVEKKEELRPIESIQNLQQEIDKLLAPLTPSLEQQIEEEDDNNVIRDTCSRFASRLPPKRTLIWNNH